MLMKYTLILLFSLSSIQTISQNIQGRLIEKGALQYEEMNFDSALVIFNLALPDLQSGSRNIKDFQSVISGTKQARVTDGAPARSQY